MLVNAKRVYALVSFTVELRQRGWFYWPTYGEKGDAKGPYSSIGHADDCPPTQARDHEARRSSSAEWLKPKLDADAAVEPSQ
jgi:hypothetical protein